jgi:hypothetical protein
LYSAEKLVFALIHPNPDQPTMPTKPTTNSESNDLV